MPKLSDCPQGQEDNRLPKAKRSKKNDRQPLALLPPALLSNRRTPCNKRPAEEMGKVQQPLEKRRKLSPQDFSESGAAASPRAKFKVAVSTKAKAVAGTGDKKKGAEANPKVRLKARVSAKAKAVAGTGDKKKGAEANPKVRLKAEVSTKANAVAGVGGKKSSAAIASGGGLGKPSSAMGSSVVKSKGFAFIPTHLPPINKSQENISEPVKFSAMPISKQLGRTKAPQASAASSKGPADEAVSNSSNKEKIKGQDSRISRRRGGLSDILAALDLGCMTSSESQDRNPDSFSVLASTNDVYDNAMRVSEGHSAQESASIDLSFARHASISEAQMAMVSGSADSDSDNEDNEELSHIFGSLGL